MPRWFEQNWADTFRYVAERSPFYRELFRGLNGVPPLDQVQIIDQRVLSERNLDFLCVPRERVVEIVTTSGTTGNSILWMLTEADLRQFARDNLAHFKVPQGYTFVGELPKTATGKIQKYVLRGGRPNMAAQ